MEDEFTRKLKEKYENGQISRETYEEILKRYIDEIEEEKVEEEHEKIIESEEYENSTPEGDEKTTAEYLEEKVFKKIDSNEIENKAEDKQGRDYKCAGACTIPAGRYNYISASGSVKVTGDIRAKKLSVAGSLHSDGNIWANILSIGGSAKIDGNVVSEDISSGGVLHAKMIMGERIRLGGAIVFEKLKGEDVKIEGSVKGVNLKAENLKMKIDGKSSLERIVAERVEIRSKKGVLRKFRGTMKVDEIFGEEIYVESARAKLIKGEKVIIGDNCIVEKVKAERVKVSKKSKVVEVVKK